MQVPSRTPKKYHVRESARKNVAIITDEPPASPDENGTPAYLAARPSPHASRAGGYSARPSTM
jgi:hypothetical protein